MPKFDRTEHQYVCAHYEDRKLVLGVTDLNGKRWLLENGCLIRGEEKHRITKKTLCATIGF